MELQTEAAVHCLACKQPGEGNLCSYCGELLHPKRITFIKLFQDIPDLFDIEHGLFYTVRTFLTRPGQEIRDYFAGIRSKHYKPVKFVLFITGLLTLLMVSADINDGTTTSEDYASNFSAVILLFQFPIVALLTWMIFRKRKYTYGEHFVANAFLIGEVIIFNIICFPVYMLVNGTSGVILVQGVYLIWIYIYYTYAFYDWFYNKKTAAGFFKSAGVTFIVYFTVLGILTPVIEYLIRHYIS